MHERAEALGALELDEEDLGDDLHVDEDDEAVIGTVGDEIEDEDEQAEGAAKAAKPCSR